MKLSIITVSYNSVRTLEDTLLSVASQISADFEHILIDGASTDGSVELIERYRDTLAHAISEPDNGLYHAMNKGVALASGDVIGFLNADDVYSHARVLSIVTGLLADQSVDACYGDVVYVGAQDSQKIVRYFRSGPYREGHFESGWMPAHPTFFARKAVYDNYGGYDLAFKLQSDFDLTMRFMAVNKIKVIYLPQVLVNMRMGGVTNNKFSNVIKGNIEAYRACKQNGLDVTPFFIVKKIFSRIPQFFARPRNSKLP